VRRQETKEDRVSEKRILVVYYTSAGSTGKVARALATELGADLEAIQPEKRVDVDIKGKGLRNFGNMGRVVMGGRRQRTVPLAPAQHDPAAYALVVVGTPVYANTLPAEPRSYLVQQRDKLAKVAFFCTGEDPANAHVFDLMAEACGRTPVAIQPFHAPRVKADDIADDLTAFAARLALD